MSGQRSGEPGSIFPRWPRQSEPLLIHDLRSTVLLKSLLRVLFGTRNSLLLLALDAAMLALVALAMLGTPPSRIDREFGGASVQISAESAWILAPRTCTDYHLGFHGNTVGNRRWSGKERIRRNDVLPVFNFVPAQSSQSRLRMETCVLLFRTFVICPKPWSTAWHCHFLWRPSSLLSFILLQCG